MQLAEQLQCRSAEEAKDHSGELSHSRMLVWSSSRRCVQKAHTGNCTSLRYNNAGSLLVRAESSASLRAHAVPSAQVSGGTDTIVRVWDVRTSEFER